MSILDNYDLTLGQMERVEQISGMTISDFFASLEFEDTDTAIMPPLNILRGIAYLTFSMKGNELTDDELRNVSIKQLEALNEEFQTGESTPA